MAAWSTGTSPGSIMQPRNSSSEEDLVVVKDQKKRKRLMSNRESARRSRLKKQHQLNSLLAELRQLEEENQQMVVTMALSSQLYLDMEAENSALKAQMAELNYRLMSLKQIINFICSSSSSCYNNGLCDSAINTPLDQYHNHVDVMNNGGGFYSMNVLASPFYMNQPSMAAPTGRFI